jgi:hypothetical protein
MRSSTDTPEGFPSPRAPERVAQTPGSLDGRPSASSYAVGDDHDAHRERGSDRLAVANRLACRSQGARPTVRGSRGGLRRKRLVSLRELSRAQGAWRLWCTSAARAGWRGRFVRGAVRHRARARPTLQRNRAFAVHAHASDRHHGVGLAAQRPDGAGAPADRPRATGTRQQRRDGLAGLEWHRGARRWRLSRHRPKGVL